VRRASNGSWEIVLDITVGVKVREKKILLLLDDDLGLEDVVVI